MKYWNQWLDRVMEGESPSVSTVIIQLSFYLSPIRGADCLGGASRNGTPLNGIKVNTFQVGLPQTDQTWWKYEVSLFSLSAMEEKANKLSWNLGCSCDSRSNEA